MSNSSEYSNLGIEINDKICPHCNLSFDKHTKIHLLKCALDELDGSI